MVPCRTTDHAVVIPEGTYASARLPEIVVDYTTHSSDAVPSHPTTVTMQGSYKFSNSSSSSTLGAQSLIKPRAELAFVHPSDNQLISKRSA